MRRSLFQRRAGLMTLTATTAAGRQSYRVQDVGTMAGVELADSAIPGLLSEFRVPEEGNG
jgi:putative membrane protein